MGRIATIMVGAIAIVAIVQHARGPAVPVMQAPDSHDLGYTDNDVQAWVRFPVSNVGRADLVLTRWRNSCSCMEAMHGGKAVPESVRIAPGSTYDIELAVTMKKDAYLPGSYSLHFQTNDPLRPNHSFSVKFNPVGGLIAVPAELDFGSSAPGSKPVVQSVTLYKTQFAPSDPAQRGGGSGGSKSRIRALLTCEPSLSRQNRS
jgi:hypothetical protein